MRNLPSRWALCCSALLLSFASVATAEVPIIPSGEIFTCTPTHVWDGDGPIWCEEGPRLRLAGIAARELDGMSTPRMSIPADNPGPITMNLIRSDRARCAKAEASKNRAVYPSPAMERPASSRGVRVGAISTALSDCLLYSVII